MTLREVLITIEHGETFALRIFKKRNKEQDDGWEIIFSIIYSIKPAIVWLSVSCTRYAWSISGKKDKNVWTWRGELLNICILCIIYLKNIDVLFPSSKYYLGLKDSNTSDRYLNWVCVLVYVLVGGVVTCVAFSRSNLVWLMVLWVSCSWDWSWLFSLETSSNSWHTQTHAAVNNWFKRGKQMFLTSIWVLSADLLEILGVRASSLGAVVKPGETGRGQRHCYHWDCADRMKKEEKSNRSKATFIPGTQLLVCL